MDEGLGVPAAGRHAFEAQEIALATLGVATMLALLAKDGLLNPAFLGSYS